MKILTILLIFLSFEIFGQNVNKTPFHAYMPGYNNAVGFKNRFELSVYRSDFSQSLTLRYLLTERYLKVMFIGTLDGEKDQLIYSNDLIPNQISKKIASIKIDNLDEYYSNPCIKDGSQIMVNLNWYTKNKTVQLSNFYQKDIGFIIESINSLLPKKYSIWYDKRQLVKDQENCR